jgi:hypothetical protein
MAKEVKLSVLKEQVNSGMKLAELATYYDLPKSQVSKMLKKAGLTIRKFAVDKFELVDDTVIQLNDENSTDITETTIEQF